MYILLERAHFETAGRWYESQRFDNRRDAKKALKAHRKRWTGLYEYMMVLDLQW